MIARILGTLVVLTIWSIVLAGCPGLPKPDGCTPMATRCTAAGLPQTCSQTQRWTSIGQPCPVVGAVCCYTASAFRDGRGIYACARPESCIPDPAAGVDGGAVDAVATAEGGAP